MKVSGKRPFSANGAALYQPGATPQETRRLQSRALKARLIAGGRRSFGGTIGRAFSPEHSRLTFSWGVAPGWYDAAPLALNIGRTNKMENGKWKMENERFFAQSSILHSPFSILHF